MGYTFDGPNKRIILTTGTISVDVADMYSRWKDWMLLSDNAKYLQALSVIGGDETPTGFVGSTFFLENGWRIRPQEANHTLTITGNLYVRGGGNAVVATLGTYQVLTTLTVSNLVDTISVGSGLSTEEHNALMLAADVAGGGWTLDSENKQMVLHKSDNTTEVARFDLFEEDGETPTAINVFVRKRVI